MTDPASEWEPLHCLQPGCIAAATADEPSVHDGTGGPVLVWRVTCAAGHRFSDFTETCETDSAL